MAVLTTITVVLGAWCAASVITAALYAAARARHIRRQRAVASALDAASAWYEPAPAPAPEPGAFTWAPTPAGSDRPG